MIKSAAGALGIFVIAALLSAQSLYADELPVQLLMGETKVSDRESGLSRVDPSTFTSTLRFIFGTDPSLQIVDLSKISAGTPSSGYRLDSTLQSFRENVVWAGELRKVGDGASNQPISLGPVVLADEGGLKPNALTQIVALVKRQLSKEGVSLTKPVSIYACLQPDSSALAKQVADDFRRSFASTLIAPNLIAVQPSPPCMESSGPLSGNTARITGKVSQRAGMLTIDPFLQWNDYWLPLPTFSGRSETGLKFGPAYSQMLSRATVAAFREYPLDVLASFKTGRSKWLDDERPLLGLDDYPYLKVAALQRRKKDDARKAYEIGRVFESAKEPEFAKDAFNKAIRLNSDWKDPYRELGTVLFELQQYDAAEDALKNAMARAKDTVDPETLEKYAQVAFLLGKPDAARDALEKLFSSSTGSFQSRLLAVRISLLDGKLDEAVGHVAAATKLPDSDPTVISQAARAITTKIMDSSPGNDQLKTATAALDLVPESSGGLWLPALKGRVQLLQGLLIDINRDPDARNRASEKFTNAINYYRKVAAAPSKDPEFEVIELDLSEALFLAANYALNDEQKKTDLRSSAEAARAMLKKADPRGLGFSSYHPVALLLIAGGDYLQNPASDPRPEFSRQLRELPDVPDRPHLSVNVSAAKQSIAIRITQWSFGSFDTTVCKLDNPERQILTDLSELTKNKVNSPTNKAC